MSLSMRDRLNATSAPAWHPTVQGDILTGVVAGRSSRKSDNGDYEVITVIPSEAPTMGGSTTFNTGITDPQPYTGGPLAWHVTGKVAESAVAENNPQVGDAIGVLFGGTGIAQSGHGKGKEYRIFKVVVDHAAAPVVPNQTEALPFTPGFVTEIDDAETSVLNDDEEF